MKTFLNIIIGLLIVANSAFAFGLYNYTVKGEAKNWEKLIKFINEKRVEFKIS